MKTLTILSGAVVAVMCFGFGLVAQEAPPPAPNGAAQPKQAPKAPANSPAAKAKDAAKPSAQAEDKAGKEQPTKAPAGKGDPNAVTESSVPAENAPDEQAIRKIHDGLVKAYASDDAKAVASHFTTNGEYINAQGTIFQGRTEIEESLTDYLKEHPGCKLESTIDAIRFVSPTVALVDGITAVDHEDEGDTDTSHCHFAAVYVKAGDKWEIASIRDRMVFVRPEHEHEDMVAQLDFLTGDWIDEDAHSVVSFSCKPTDNGKFLLREFTLKIAGQDVLTGTQRIGWDPLSGELRSWIFDSEGGFAEGIWEQIEDGWVMHASGVTSEGEVASGSSIYKIINDHTMTWQLVDQETGGSLVEDSPVFTLTRRAPRPGDKDETIGQKESSVK